MYSIDGFWGSACSRYYHNVILGFKKLPTFFVEKTFKSELLHRAARLSPIPGTKVLWKLERIVILNGVR